MDTCEGNILQTGFIHPIVLRDWSRVYTIDFPFSEAYLRGEECQQQIHSAKHEPVSSTGLVRVGCMPVLQELVLKKKRGFCGREEMKG